MFRQPEGKSSLESIQLYSQQRRAQYGNIVFFLYLLIQTYILGVARVAGDKGKGGGKVKFEREVRGERETIAEALSSHFAHEFNFPSPSPFYAGHVG